MNTQRPGCDGADVYVPMKTVADGTSINANRAQ
jgi:hypothetical protein